ncbi:restriction endonuclease subunit S [Marinitoga lauensis]|uniref:restriction endonuclease subunit S n=1 Tax=Marinitoga lauensis TaxID=2201189 RepID=UPI001013398E|nr:restriction endonuclease subunit S [Marinitoga lauensis]
MASYVIIPKVLSINEIENKGFTLSPSLFKRVEFKNQNVRKVKDLLDRELKPKDKGFEVGSKSYIYNSKYFFIRTKSLQPTSFLPNYDKESIVPILPQSFKNYNLKEGDILISKDSNIGEAVILDKDLSNYMPSGGIYRLPISKWKYYLLAFMKNDFFKSQLNFLASRGATIKHAKTLFLDCLIPFPNQINADEIIKYVELLTKSIIDKEKEIRRKHKLILEKIEKELLENQKPNKFEYKLPHIGEIESKTRIDAGIYSENFRYIDFIVKNYIHGFYFIDKEKIFGGNTPKKRIISNKDNLKYKWLTPTQISDYGHIINLETISMPTKNNLNKSAMLLINRTSKGGRGEYVGISLFYDFNIFGEGHHNQGIYRVVDYPIQQLQFMTAFMNTELMRQYCANLSVGSKMKEIKIYQFLTIPFPNFPESKQKEVAELYYNFVDYPTDLNLNNFLEEDAKWNEKAGILQLDLSAKKLKKRLNEIIHQIVMNEKVKIDFEVIK